MNHRRAGKDAQVEEIALLSLVRQHGSVAIAGLLKVIHTSKSDRLRVSAINMLLDLGYGRPPQASDIVDRDEVGVAGEGLALLAVDQNLDLGNFGHVGGEGGDQRIDG